MTAGGPAADGPIRFAVDVQVLQTEGRPKAEWPGWPGWPPGTTPLREIQAHVASYAGSLARSGKMAAALLAPEYPAPDPSTSAWGLGDLVGLLRWDSRAEVRRLVQAAAAEGWTLVHHVAAPFVDSGYGDPAGQVVSEPWEEAGVPRVVTVYDLDPLEKLAGSSSTAAWSRYQARAEWVARADLILAATPASAEQVTGLLGYPADRVLVLESVPEPRLAERVAAALDCGPAAPAARPAPTERTASPLPLKVGLVGPFPPHGGGIGAYNEAVLSALADPGPDRDEVRFDAVVAVEGWTSEAWQPPAGVGRIHPESLGTDVRAASYDHLVYTLGNSSGHLATVEAALRHPGWLWLHETRLPAVATTALEQIPPGDPSAPQAGAGADESFEARMAWLLERAYPGRAPVVAARAAGRSHLALAEAGVGLTAPLVARSAGVLVNSVAARNYLLLDLPPLAWHPPVHVVPPGCPPVRPRRRHPSTAPEPGVADRLVAAFGVVSMSKRPDVLVEAAARSGCRLVFVGPCPPILAELIGDRARHLGAANRVEVTGAVTDEEWWAWMDRATLAVQLREQSSGELSAAVLDALSAGLPVLTNLPSAADYPDGTVAFVPGGPGSRVEAEPLASALENLLGAPAVLEALSRAGQEFAAANQMEDLAAALLAILAGEAG